MIVIAIALVFMTILFIYFTSNDKMTIYSMKLKNIEEKIELKNISNIILHLKYKKQV